MPVAGINSKTDICNLALSRLGQPPINSIETPENKVEKLMRLLYDPTRREVLKLFDFNCATKRAILPRLLHGSAFGDWVAYELPSDYIQFLSINEDSIIEHKVEGGALLTDISQSSLNIRYTCDFDVVTKMSPLLISTIADMLASQAAYPLTNSRTSEKELYEKALNRLRLAAQADSKESPVRVVNNFRSYIKGY